MNYALVGYGRMGKAIEAQAEARGHRRMAILDTPGKPLDAGRLAGADVAFEFTVGQAAETNVTALLDAGVSVVCGTTDWQPGPALRSAVERSSAAVILAPNFSVGMNVFFHVVDRAARLFGRLGLHDPFVSEAHHRGKLDAPSGTARKLASIVLEASPRLNRIEEGSPSGGLPGETLQVVSLRAGGEPGRHTVGFDGAHDVITLSHGARGREGFALGAVLAAEWLGGRRGLYRFDEVLEQILDRTLQDGAEER